MPNQDRATLKTEIERDMTARAGCCFPVFPVQGEEARSGIERVKGVLSVERGWQGWAAYDDSLQVRCEKGIIIVPVGFVEALASASYDDSLALLGDARQAILDEAQRALSEVLRRRIEQAALAQLGLVGGGRTTPRRYARNA